VADYEWKKPREKRKGLSGPFWARLDALFGWGCGCEVLYWLTAGIQGIVGLVTGSCER
jgi:hypothetical protein